MDAALAKEAQSKLRAFLERGSLETSILNPAMEESDSDYDTAEEYAPRTPTPTPPRLTPSPTSTPRQCVLPGALDNVKVECTSTFEDVSTGTLSANLEAESPTTAEEAQTSLFYLFNTLPSPDPLRRLNAVQDCNLRRLVKKVWSRSASDLLLRTSLYDYQKRSIAQMLLMEAEHGGGVLAEDMGLGKTLICIGLIMSNLYTTTPPPKNTKVVDMGGNRSLKEMVTRQILYRTPHYEIEDLEDLPRNVREGLKERGQVTYEHSELLSKSARELPGRIKVVTKPVYMSHGTVVVVPANLVKQWKGEFEKHVRKTTIDGGFELAIKVKTFTSGKDALPPAEELLEYDVLLFSKTRFDDEERDGKDSLGRRFSASFSRSSTPCSPRPRAHVYESPLFKIHWRRLIVDEGHSMVGHSFAAEVAAKLLATAKWVVSGTPTRSLVGIGTTGITDDFGEDALDALEARRQSAEGDRHDLDRVRGLLGDFLQIPEARAAGGSKAWMRGIIREMKHSPSAIDKLKVVLEKYFVRHQARDVRKDVKLPSLTHKTIYLDPGRFEKLSINLFAAAIHSNSITSERVGADYLFTPSQRQFLNLLTHNLLQQSTFYWTGHTIEQTMSTLKVAKRYLDHREASGNLSKADRKGLLDTIHACEDALEDPYWRTLSTTHEIGYYTRGTGSKLALWRWPELRELEENRPEMLLGRAVVELQNFVKSTDWTDAATSPDSIIAGRGVVFNERIKNALLPEDKQKMIHQADKAAADVNSSNSPKNRRRRASKPKTNSEPTSPSPPTEYTLPQDSSLRSATIHHLTSSKLTYLLRRVLALSPSHKILIFYASENPAYYIGEALDILQIPHLFFAKSLDAKTRGLRLEEFSNEEKYRVMLMDLKQASHGLNVTVADRVFFLTPVWESAVEAQAIKRCHRIGQTREVVVETLVLKGTIEEALLERRKKLREGKREVKGGVMEDAEMRRLIEEIPFLRDEDVKETPEEDGLNAPLFGKENGPVSRASYGIDEERENIPPTPQTVLPTLIKLERTSPSQSSTEPSRSIIGTKRRRSDLVGILQPAGTKSKRVKSVQFA